MRGAFVVRLRRETNPSTGHFEGSVEEVDSGKELKFQSSAELLKFLGERVQTSFAGTREDGGSITPEERSRTEAKSRRLEPSNKASRRRRQ